jgi:hypothetical protein
MGSSKRILINEFLSALFLTDYQHITIKGYINSLHLLCNSLSFRKKLLFLQSKNRLLSQPSEAEIAKI